MGPLHPALGPKSSDSRSVQVSGEIILDSSELYRSSFSSRLVLILLPWEARLKWSVSPMCLSCIAVPFCFSQKQQRQWRENKRMLHMQEPNWLFSTGLPLLCAAWPRLCLAFGLWDAGIRVPKEKATQHPVASSEWKVMRKQSLESWNWALDETECPKTKREGW